jgi:hypothetical protein
MRKLITIYFACISFIAATSQNISGVSNVQSFNIQKNIAPIIRKYVETKINSWQKKGEFEKTNDYQNRVNETTRNQMIEKYQKEAFEIEKKKYTESIDLKNIKLKEYDADNETFLLYSEILGNIIVSVPIESGKAKRFKENFNSLYYYNLDFIFSNNKFILSELEIRNNNDIFSYNNKNQSTYALTKIDYNFSDIEVDVPNQTVTQNNNIKQTNKISVGKSDVDVNIPNNNISKPHSYALIIGNEDYTTFQPDLSSEVNVDFANNDATVFKTYCEKTLGIPTKHIKYYNNATGNGMTQGIDWLKGLADTEKGKAELIVYYSGHGMPDEATGESYLIPVDVSGYNVKKGVSLKWVFKELNQYPTKKTTVFLDACFSGGARNQGLIAMKGVKIKPKEEVLMGNIVVFASSSGNESSGVYREKQHGYFTYFLLKKLQETNGDITYKEMSDHLKYIVEKESRLASKKQTPQINVSSAAEDIWGSWSFR